MHKIYPSVKHKKGEQAAASQYHSQVLSIKYIRNIYQKVDGWTGGLPIQKSILYIISFNVYTPGDCNLLNTSIYIHMLYVSDV